MSTEVQEAGPRVLAHGRFKLSQAPDESLHVGLATDICDRCRECGCGEGKQYHVPPMMVKMFGGKIRGIFGDGDDDEPGPAAA